MMQDATLYQSLQARHSKVFCVLACCILLFAGQITAIHPTIILFAITASIIVLGLPHGALDTLFAQQHWRLHSWFGWLLFVIGYVLLAWLVVLCWQWQPVVFFVGFLIISALHFADDLPSDFPLWMKWLHGGTLIILPTLLHQDVMVQLFAYFISVQQSTDFVKILHGLAYAWLLGLVASCCWVFNKNKLCCAEMALAGLLAIFVSPLVAFTVYFCGLHSVRHLIRSSVFLHKVSPTIKLLALLVPTLTVLIMAILGWQLLQTHTLETNLIQLIFVSLAALTLPHMLLLYCAGFTKWKKI